MTYAEQLHLLTKFDLSRTRMVFGRMRAWRTSYGIKVQLKQDCESIDSSVYMRILFDGRLILYNRPLLSRWLTYRVRQKIVNYLHEYYEKLSPHSAYAHNTEVVFRRKRIASFNTELVSVQLESMKAFIASMEHA